MNISRKETITVPVGHLLLGSRFPILIQSMTNTSTSDISATVVQVKNILTAGADMVRIAVPTMKDVDAFKKIRANLRAEGIIAPLIADVHFLPEIAEAVAPWAEKVRINPGNFVDKRQLKKKDFTDSAYREALEKMAQRARPLLEICKQNGTAIRVGVNQGSLSDRIIHRYGNTPEAMAQSAMEWIDICEQADFSQLVFSMKSSRVNTMIEATLLLDNLMEKRGVRYPLHLGVTEAANGMEARVKSTIGICTLLMHGLGDTVRISLTENPENEIHFAKKMLSVYDNYDERCYILQDGTLTVVSQETDMERWWAVVAISAAKHHISKKINHLISNNFHFSLAENEDLAATVMQACRIKIFKTEIIACPSCGRTQYDIQAVLAKVKEKFSDYPGLKIGVMGCVVNGPGEMADADFGIVGSANNKIAIYRKGERVSDFLPIEKALTLMEEVILKFKRE